MNCPFISLVPKDMKENLRWRRGVIQEGLSSPASAKELWIMCKRDHLFYFNTFCYLHEPRPGRALARVIPFITYDFQDHAFDEILSAIRNDHDLCIVKSRDMGASWMNIAAFEYLWHFEHGMSFAMVSRNENYVDDPGNMKALFQKIDFLHKYQPDFIKPAMYRVKMHIENLETGSTIDGESTTGKVARGDRRTAVLLDEFDAFESSDGFSALSSTQFATGCRIFNSTFESNAGAFYRVFENAQRWPDSGVKLLTLPWWDHPMYSKDLYFDEDGKRRSPWYDKECKKAGDPRIIAKELDMDPGGSQSRFFTQAEIAKIKTRTVRPPLHVGELDFDQTTALHPSFIESQGGRLELWVDMNEKGNPQIEPTDEFSIGADISAGTGVSNSVLSVTNRANGIKVASWVDPMTRPHHLGKVAVALALWFNKALIVPESPGPGVEFTKCVMEDLRYSAVYFRQNQRTLEKKITLTPGWWPTPEDKWRLFTEYRRALTTGLFTNPSEVALNECLDYVYFGNTIWHAKAVKNDDPSGARDNHGDRPTADALSWLGCRYSPIRPSEAQPDLVPYNSIAGRRERWAKQKREKELAWQ